MLYHSGSHFIDCSLCESILSIDPTKYHQSTSPSQYANTLQCIITSNKDKALFTQADRLGPIRQT